MMTTDELFEKIFQYAKKGIEESDLRNIDRTAELFCDLFNELGRSDLAEKLYKIYVYNNIIAEDEE